MSSASSAAAGSSRSQSAWWRLQSAHPRCTSEKKSPARMPPDADPTVPGYQLDG
jgi:hypothetical protein